MKTLTAKLKSCQLELEEVWDDCYVNEVSIIGYSLQFVQISVWPERRKIWTDSVPPHCSAQECKQVVNLKLNFVDESATECRCRLSYATRKQMLPSQSCRITSNSFKVVPHKICQSFWGRFAAHHFFSRFRWTDSAPNETHCQQSLIFKIFLSRSMLVDVYVNYFYMALNVLCFSEIVLCCCLHFVSSCLK